jgi:hypothetical protein
LAGFEIRDQLAWVFGSGFPKSHNIGKAIDKAAGAMGALGSGFNVAGIGRSNGGSKFRSDHPEYQPFAPATDDAKKWEGWGTALKPAFEPILLARKPLIGTVVQNVLKHGTGAINIDGCRIAADGEIIEQSGEKVDTNCAEGYDRPNSTMFRTGKPKERGGPSNSQGRWPANLAHDGSEEVLALFPQSKSPATYKRSVHAEGEWLHAKPAESMQEGYGDNGSAARFFYCAKASKSDRGEGNIHPTVKPHELMKWLARLITPTGGVILDPFLGSGSTGKASVVEGFNFIGIEMDDAYFDIAKNRILETKTPKLPELPEGFEYE